MSDYFLKPYSPHPRIINSMTEKLGISLNPQKWNLVFIQERTTYGHFGFIYLEIKVLGNLENDEFITYRLIHNSSDPDVKEVITKSNSLEELKEDLLKFFDITDKQIIEQATKFQAWKVNHLENQTV